MNKGLGDSIASVADVVAKIIGLENCACEKRREYLNELFPYEQTQRRFKVMKGFVHNHIRFEKDAVITVTKNDSVHQAVIGYVGSGSLIEL